ncbi:MAG: carboxypeptidase regulatory-like domain-containing protein [Bryobacteraceae bacterium]
MLKTLRFLVVSGIALGLLEISPVPLCGQGVAGAQIAGVVTDPSGAAVGGVKVTATQTETNAVHTAVTDVNGAYVMPNLAVGPYRLEATAAGFQRYVQTGILLSVGNDVSINVALTIGSAQQEIQVTANATMVETHDTSTSQVIDQQRVLDLPLNGREASSLILISGGAVDAASVASSISSYDLVSTKNYGSANIVGTSAISIGGGQASGTNYMMDGGDNNDGYTNVNMPFPFPDAIQEFSVQTNGLAARYGVHPGGAVNIITKSGTNQYHGDLFEFLRNGDLNARNFFAATHDNLRRNQFGGTVGGPVKKDKLFFFFGYQGTRVRTDPPSTISYVPTAAALNGDFSQLESAGCQSSGKAKTISNPATGQPFPGAQVPVSLFNQQALNILKYAPIATNPCGTVTYGVPSTEDEDQYIGRVDWTKSDKHMLFARYFITQLVNPPPVFDNNVLNTNAPGLHDRSQAVTIGDNYTFSSTALNSLRLTFSRPYYARTNDPNAIDAPTVGIDVFTPVRHYLDIGISSYFTIGGGGASPNPGNRRIYMGAADDFDLIRGRHHISFGGSWLREVLQSAGFSNALGVWTFNGSLSGDSLVDFMLGDPSSFGQGNPTLTAVRGEYVGAYVQDDFQVNRRLTLHFGLRWEPFLAFTDIYHRGYYFSPSAFMAGTTSTTFVNAPPGLRFIGDPGVAAGYAPNKLGDFEPRLGLAWDLTGNGRQTIRVSYGIFYDLPVLLYAGSRIQQSPPWGSNTSLTDPPNGLTNPFQAYGGSDPYPTGGPTKSVNFVTAGVYINIPPPVQPTYAQEWSASYQFQISANWMLSATYMSNKTTHLWGITEEDPGVYIPGNCSAGQYGLTAAGACSTTKNTAQRRVLYLENPVAGKYFSTIALADDGANSIYNAALLALRHRFSNSYTVLANYTYSHCISEATELGDLVSPQYQNPYNRDASRANCAFDIRQIANVSLVAQSPHFGTPWENRAFGNWQLAPLLSMHTGTWFSPLTGVDNSLTGVGLDRPNMVGNPYVRNTSTRQWLNPTAFVANALGTFGNAGAYSLQGPGYIDLDLALSRSFQLSESKRLEARFEAFNSLNHTNFSNPTATLTSAQFGNITSALSPRILQVALKLSF